MITKLIIILIIACLIALAGFLFGRVSYGMKLEKTASKRKELTQNTKKENMKREHITALTETDQKIAQMNGGKCKEDFEKWLNSRDGYRQNEGLFLFKHFPFKNYPFEMQSGVYLAFFDSVGICVEIHKTPSTNTWYYMINDSSEEDFDDIFKPTRTEALTEAIKQANKMYNEKDC